MKNQESHGSKKQGLQGQAAKLLPTITHELAQLGYLDIVHQRLSQQNDSAKTYQGLSRAVHQQFNEVMIKWQLSTDILLDSTSLNHEIGVLRILNSLQSSNETANENAIAPPILAYEILSLNILQQKQWLTLLAMPYYLQGSLAQHLKQSLTLQQKHQLIVQAAKTIDSLHQAGWLHNDIKPSNLLINNDEELSLLLTDFALAQPIDNSPKNNMQAKNSAGTPAYLAPERWQGQGGAVQSDIYAFGVLMYEILAGARPYAIESSTSEPLKDWAIQHCQQSVPKLPSQYNNYHDVVMKAMAKRVGQRYFNMDEVLKDLEL
ncbi:serine/threonine protein kinase [Psychrobacter sp. 2Y5]|uniref:serine/threonine protein kinase n=1 Tax=unclassified Psychrobacter TaxID=196806 RepID=UPI003F451CDC